MYQPTLPLLDPRRILVAGCLLAICSLWASFDAHQKIVRGERSLAWPSTECTVVHSAVETRVVTDRRRTDFNHRVARITCAYQARGQKFEHTWIEDSNMDAALHNYPVGRKLEIYYDPDSEDATFHPGVQDSDRSVRLWAGLAGGLGMVIVLLSFRKVMRKDVL